MRVSKTELKKIYRKELKMNISQLVRYILNHQLEYIKKRDKLTTFVDLFPDDFKSTR